MKHVKSLISILLAAAMLLGALPALAESDYAIVTASRMSVYGDPTLSDKVGTLQQYVVVTVKKVSGDVALITYCGRTGYVSTDDMDLIDASGEAATITTNGKVYETPSASARSASIKKGWKVDVLKVNGSWALIEMNGKTGYTPVSNLSIYDTPEGSTPAPAPEESPRYDAFSGTNCPDFTARAAEKVAVYSYPDTDSPKLGTLKKGASVTVTAYNGTWAQVHNGRETGYVKLSTLVVYDEFTARTDEKTTIYSTPATDSKIGTLASGVTVTVKAYNPMWSYISYNGRTGYCLNSCLVKSAGSAFEATPTPAPTATPTAAPTAAPTASATDAPDFSETVVADSYMPAVSHSEVTGTGAEYIYNYCRQVMGLNSAAACGIMVNLLRESHYNPTSLNSTGHYGICQWGGSRKTNLFRICEENGLDPESLEGQMFFLHYELRTSYKKTWERLRNVSNSQEGAYEAGYWFCYNFEAPSNRVNSGISRGTYAAETLFPEYT